MASADNPYPRSILPADWDQPSEGNEALTALFERGIFSHGELRMPYRLFTPAVRENVPLVIFLHGADAIGRDNEAQLAMHDIGTMFAAPVWQESEPCCILAPQYGPQQHWSDPRVRDCAEDLIDAVLKGRTFIDQSRIYLYGYSAGGVGVMEFLKHRPAFYAAAMAICGAVGHRDHEKLAATPLWLFHAADDRIVKCVYGDGSDGYQYYMGSREIYDRVKKIPGSEIHYTEFPEGSVRNLYGVNPHCSWVHVSGEGGAAARKWMFSKTRT